MLRFFWLYHVQTTWLFAGPGSRWSCPTGIEIRPSYEMHPVSIGLACPSSEQCSRPSSLGFNLGEVPISRSQHCQVYTCDLQAEVSFWLFYMC